MKSELKNNMLIGTFLISAYILTYLGLSVAGKYQAAAFPKGNSLRNTYVWEPRLITQSSFLESSYTPLLSLDRAFWHTNVDMGWHL